MARCGSDPSGWEAHLNRVGPIMDEESSVAAKMCAAAASRTSHTSRVCTSKRWPVPAPWAGESPSQRRNMRTDVAPAHADGPPRIGPRRHVGSTATTSGPPSAAAERAAISASVLARWYGSMPGPSGRLLRFQSSSLKTPRPPDGTSRGPRHAAAEDVTTARLTPARRQAARTFSMEARVGPATSSSQHESGNGAAVWITKSHPLIRLARQTTGTVAKSTSR